jgi:predicted nucleic acid-binding protein
LGLIDAFLAAAAKTRGIPLWSLDKSLRRVLAAKECYTPD